MFRGCLLYFFFFFNDTATTEIYTLSLHDALPICRGGDDTLSGGLDGDVLRPGGGGDDVNGGDGQDTVSFVDARSEEHTSELQSRQYLVCRLLLEKKKKEQVIHLHYH